jgi:co-chaperonin GroES (HSP10)
MKFKNIEACGDYVVLKIVRTEEKKETKTKSGIILPNKENEATKTNVNGERITASFFIEKIGPLVDANKYGFKVGDCCLPNNYDCQYIGDDEGNMYALCKAESIKCIVEEGK